MKFADYYFMIWCFFIPITSVVIVPVIKGSLISYIFAFISPLIFLFYPKAMIVSNKVRKNHNTPIKAYAAKSFCWIALTISGFIYERLLDQSSLYSII